MSDGFPIVLTADRTLTADYRLLFDGMLAASQTTTAPPALFGRLLMPRGSQPGRAGGGCPFGPAPHRGRLAGRRIFARRKWPSSARTNSMQAIGAATRVIGISSGEPAGLGMNSSTMTAVAGGRIYPQAMFRRLMRRIHRLNRDVPAKIVLGGPGAWQIAGDSGRPQGTGHRPRCHRLCRRGRGRDVPQLDAAGAVPEVVPGGWSPAVPIPPIRGASTMGVVEISRGCGLGCSFCTIARVPMVHLPPETILADVQTNWPPAWRTSPY